MDKPTEMELRCVEAARAAAGDDLTKVRAVIRAMYEPTKEMVAHGRWVTATDQHTSDADNTAEGWRDMIDAASPPKPE